MTARPSALGPYKLCTINYPTTCKDAFFLTGDKGKWLTNTVYNVGDIVYNANAYSAYLLQCTTGGKSGASQPTWPTATGGSITDNLAVWTAIALPANWTIPTTQPAVGSPQASFTVQQSDLPTFSGNAFPYSNLWASQIYVGGFNISGATITNTYVIYKNGTQVGSGTGGAVATGSYWSNAISVAGLVSVGDVIDLYVYANGANNIIDYAGLTITPTQVILQSPTSRGLAEFTLTNNGTATFMRAFTGAGYSPCGYLYPYKNGSGVYSSVQTIVNDQTYDFISTGNSTGIYRQYWGDGVSSQIYGGGSGGARTCPMSPRPTKFAWRELRW